MATDIVLRSIKAAALTHAEMDQNWESLAQTIDSQTSSYTVLVADQNKIIEANISSGTITLPTVANAAGTDTDSFKIAVKNIHATSLTLTGNGSETIDGAGGVTLLTNECVTLSLSANAAEWTIIAVHGPNLTGITATSTEINYTDIATLGTAQANKVMTTDGSNNFNSTGTVQATQITGTTVNASTTLQIGGASVTATSTELNYSVGVTSSIQTQLNNKQTLNSGLSDIASLAKTNSNFIVGNGSNWIAETGATARTSLGLGTIDNVTHNDLTVNDIGANNVIANDVNVNGAFTSLGIDDNATSVAITIDASENIGIGVTPKSWTNYADILEIGPASIWTSGLTETNISSNVYYNSGTKYKNTSKAVTYSMDAGQHSFQVAPSGTAGTAITFTTALTLDNSTNATFGGNISLADSKFLYLGDSNDFSLTHDGSNTSILSYTGGFFIQNLSNSQLITYYTRDSGGVDRINMIMGGVIPSLKLHYNGSEVFKTVLNGVNLADNKHLYLGTGNDIDIYHDGATSLIIDNSSSGFQIWAQTNSSTISLRVNDSVGAAKFCLQAGGAIPNVELSYNGIKEGETLSGSLDGTNDLTIAGSTEIVKESKVDWANAGGLTQGIIASGAEEAHSLTTTSIIVHGTHRIYVPLNANAIEVEVFAKINAGAVNMNVEVGTEIGSIISSFTTSFVSRTMTVDITAISGWQNLQIRAVADASRTLTVRGTSFRII